MEFRRRLAGWLGIFVLLTSALCWGPGSRAQPVKESTNQKKFVGAMTCARCHSGGVNEFNRSDFVLLDEYKRWKSEDRHAQAFAVLFNERSKRMSNLLGVDDVSKDARCLACHGVVVPSELQGRAFTLADGVSCDGCHGPAEAWIVPHVSEPGWLERSPAEKEKQYGMRDVRDPVSRARLCLSCHLGSVPEGKVITHEMYAAGHPPLPSFELESFADNQPKHWRPLDKKNPKVWKLFGYQGDESLRTRQLLISAAVSLETMLRLAADQASKPTEPSGSAWPELAQFDCCACHHDLRQPAWRQERGYRGRPGRPQLREWPFALVRLALRHVGSADSALDDALKPLFQALDARPFGEAAAVANQARAALPWVEQLVEKLRTRKCTDEACRKLLVEITTMVATEVPDYDTARQLSWAFQVIYQDLRQKSKQENQVRGHLSQLNDLLLLKLPAVEAKAIKVPSEDVPHSVRELPLDKTLPAIYDYDPVKVKATFEELAKLLADGA